MTTLALAIVALVMGGGWFYTAQRQAVRQEVEADLLTIAGLKVEQISTWRTERLGDAAVLMEDPFSGETATAWLAAPSAERTEQLLTRFRSLQEHFRYQDIQLVDAAVGCA